MDASSRFFPKVVIKTGAKSLGSDIIVMKAFDYIQNFT